MPNINDNLKMQFARMLAGAEDWTRAIRLRPMLTEHVQNIDRYVHESAGDVTLLAILQLEDSEKAKSYIPIERVWLTKFWHIQEPVLLYQAKLNMLQFENPVCITMSDCLASPYDATIPDDEPTKKEILARHAKKPRIMDPDFTIKTRGKVHTEAYIVTVEEYANGGCALWLPGVALKMHEALGEDYYVMFTSIHEGVVYPASYVEKIVTLEKLQADIESMKKTEGNTPEFMSGHIWKFESENRLFRMLTAKEN